MTCRSGASRNFADEQLVTGATKVGNEGGWIQGNIYWGIISILTHSLLSTSLLLIMFQDSYLYLYLFLLGNSSGRSRSLDLLYQSTTFQNAVAFIAKS